MEACSHAAVVHSGLAAAAQCAAVGAACGGSQEVVDFFSLYYCRVRSVWLMAPLALLALWLVFKFICDAVEEFIAPALLFVSKYFHLSEAFAGVTLLALANGLSDIATAFVASTADQGVEYVIGSLYGAGLFVITVVITVTIRVSPHPIVLDKAVVFRDVGFYVLATLLVLYFALTGSITTLKALAFFSLYLLLVAVVLVQEACSKGREAAQPLVLAEEESPSQPDNPDESEGLIRRGSEARNVNILSRLLRRPSTKNIFENFAEILRTKKDVEKVSKGGLAGFLYKALLVADWPFSWLRRLTILPPSPEHFSTYSFILWPFFGIPVLLWAVFETPSLLWLYYLPFALLLSAFFAVAVSDPRWLGSPRFSLLVAALSAVTAILWTKIVCGVLIDLIAFVGVVSNLPASFLGFTVIAIGNALPDALTTFAIARKGQAVMAVTGAYAGQVFGLLFGFGLSMINRCRFLGRPIEFDLLNRAKFAQNGLCLVLILFTLLAMLFTMLWVPLRKFVLEKRFGIILAIIYAVFMFFSVGIVVHRLVVSHAQN